MNPIESHEERLLKIFKARIDKMSYEDMKGRTRSGMTKFQEYIRKQGIKERRDDQPYEKEKYVAIPHPAAWACDHYYVPKYSLLFPKELALKILALGFLP